MTRDELIAALDARKAAEATAGEPMFMGIPERWFDGIDGAGARYRCENDHVSTWFLRTEQGSRCLAAGCYQPVYITFPEDVEGPWAIVIADEFPPAGTRGNLLDNGNFQVAQRRHRDDG